MQEAVELNLDGLVGPSHHYGGLAGGNLASQAHRQSVSSPKQAALEGLEKMRLVRELGVWQGVLPPQPRPEFGVLRRLGFEGTESEVLARAAGAAPDWLHHVYSASSMWAANAATLSPAADTVDARLHITPANLISHFHRSLEAPHTAAALENIFPRGPYFAHHSPLPATGRFSDEGAANHLRLCPAHGAKGLEIFVYGFGLDGERRPQRFSPRQSRDVGRAIARRHGLHLEQVLFLQQNPAAIDAGAFHNDVVALANEDVLLYHEQAFAEGATAAERISATYRSLRGERPWLLEVPAEAVPLETAVAGYLFNSQLLTLGDGNMLLLCPEETREHEAARQYVTWLVAEENPIQAVRYVSVRQSMCNGGGPACLRLRGVLGQHQLEAMHQGVLLTDELYQQLGQCIETYYRDSLSAADLADPALVSEHRAAVAEIRRTLGLPPL
jgi:succinylarginine dihydrolase